jgi:hypothetical protein
MARGDDGFAKTFSSALSSLRRRGTGCLYCSTGSCYVGFKDMGVALQRWRQELRSLSKDAREQQLRWMFWHRGAISDSKAPQKQQLPLGDMDQQPVRDPTTDEDDESNISTTKGFAIKRARAPTTSEEDVDAVERCDTTSSESDAPLDIALGAKSSEHVTKPLDRIAKQRRCYGDGHPRQGRFSVNLMGHSVCVKAAKALIGTGFGQLYRIKDGLADGRCDGTRRVRGSGVALNATKMPCVLSFLWQLYHSVGEGMPDRFSFKRNDAKTRVLKDDEGPEGSLRDEPGSCSESEGPLRKDSSSCSESEGPLRDLEEETRTVTAAVLYAESARLPPEAALNGPGMPGGPLRFLPPTRRVHLYWEYQAWCQAKGRPPASFSTFLRAFQAGRSKLRIRKAGQHAVCDTCIQLKKAIRKATFPGERQAAIEAYTHHVYDQWLDRQVYAHASELSLQCSQMLAGGYTLSNMARSISQLALIADGIDQAKFRLPRILIKGHALDSLLRPALHVQGAWCHGFGYHLAVSDADMRKDTNNNVEVIGRLLSNIYDRHGGLPLGLHLQQDNTSRECKNQWMINWAAKLVALGIFQWVTLSYLTTGHTHEDIDGTFGQLTTKLAAEEFDDDNEVIAILLRFLGQIGTDKASREASLAYKLDEAADWHHWWAENMLSLSGLTGPEAAHWFRICRLKDVGAAASSELDVPVTGAPGLPPAKEDDVVMVVRGRMASPSVQQVLRLIPAARCLSMVQPCPLRMHPRRVGNRDSQVTKDKVARAAETLHLKGAIRAAARDYLVGWSMGTKTKAPRPTTYSYLNNATSKELARGRCVGQLPKHGQPVPQLVQVAVLSARGRPPLQDDI